MYSPWKYSLIIKLIHKRVLHKYVKSKILELWKPIEQFSLIDLGSAYFIVKFTKEENVTKILQNGPWFINDFYLSMRGWEPNFVASKHSKSTMLSA